MKKTLIEERKPVTIKCDIHGKQQTELLLLNGMEFTAPLCPLCEAERKADTAKKAAAAQQERQRNIWRERNIEQAFWDKTLEDYKPENKKQEKALRAVKRLIETKNGNVVVLGSSGAGKTYLGSMAVKALGGKILSMYEIATMIRQAYSARAEKTELEIVQELAGLPILVIDDMGRTEQTRVDSEPELNWLIYVMDKRHTRQLPSMFLINGHLAKDCPDGTGDCDRCFERLMDNGVMRRLKQDFEIITI